VRCLSAPFLAGTGAELEYTASTITDGIRLTRNIAWTGNLQVQVTLIGGADVQADGKSGTYTSGGVTGIGFEPHMAFFMTVDSTSTATTAAFMSTGWAVKHPTRGLSQQTMGYNANDAAGIATMGVIHQNNCALAIPSSSAAYLLNFAQVTAMDTTSSGRVTWSKGTSSTDLIYVMSLRFNNMTADDDFGIDDFARSKALGVVDYSFTPTNTAGSPIQYARIETFADGPGQNSTDLFCGYGKGTAVVDAKGTSHSVAPHDEDGNTTMNCGNRVSSDFTISNDAQSATYWATMDLATSGTSIELGTLGSNADIEGYAIWYATVTVEADNVYKGSTLLTNIFKGTDIVSAVYNGSTQLY